MTTSNTTAALLLAAAVLAAPLPAPAAQRRQAAATGADATSTTAAAASEHPSVRRAFSLPPSAQLRYTIQARQRSLPISGDAVVAWQTGEGKYSISTESHAVIFGKILENRSEGLVDGYGLAPVTFYQKRFRKDPSTTTFKRDSKTIVFTEGDDSYPLKGGEQDRTSAPWQLLAQARANPERFKPGTEWAYFVAGSHDAEPWVFKVVNQETVHTGQGDVNALHLVKAPPPDAQGQQVDLWLAPSLEWYPVRIRFADADGDFVDQTLDKISRK
ncbi:DUF3108 domain-containing protein [Duganella sp. FT3S]|uniref:DUF3108 domain-containing protein n=1 Tax=Rugamonas fusca TaxID=2758568 RepID=A0A7W2EHB8_9BURK|nr:DUF3108 domain-containing protein [Rugamonas fusca]MBA5605921.1 DUF3108 domain-containing protein [Rugamonas fusca]